MDVRLQDSEGARKEKDVDGYGVVLVHDQEGQETDEEKERKAINRAIGCLRNAKKDRLLLKQRKMEEKDNEFIRITDKVLENLNRENDIMERAVEWLEEKRKQRKAVDVIRQHRQKHSRRWSLSVKRKRHEMQEEEKQKRKKRKKEKKKKSCQ